MAQEDTFTAEEALAALSFFSETFLFPKRDEKVETTRDLSDACIPEQFEPKVDLEWEKTKQLIPDWSVDEDGSDDEEEDDEHVPFQDDATNHQPPTSWLEQLGPDVSALILAHLSVSEIMNVTSFVSKSMYRACRTNELWRCKFVARWNYPFEPTSWLDAYKAAYGNSHELWVTHWNCVAPHDGDSPGRCCISDHVVEAADCSLEHDLSNGLKSPWMDYCPTCRYGSSGGLPPIIQQAIGRDVNGQNEKQDAVNEAEMTAAAHALLMQEDHDSLTSRARAIFASTQYSIAKWCRNERDLPSTLPVARPHRSRRAFENAATFHRNINSDQYRSSNLNFMRDALFLSLVDSHLQRTRQALTEKQHLRNDIYMNSNITSPGAPNTVSSLGASMETSHHSWHIVRFSNPDFVRPISFRIFVQRPDCFTVFPSEGFLMPGESCHVVLGVRLLGSLLTEAFEALNVQREEVDTFLADVYAHEAHLPYAPFAIRYVFAPAIPCIPPSFTSRGGIKPGQSLARPAFTQAATSKYKDMREYLWENVATEATVRTVYLSAHVSANYRLEDFQRDTLHPFDIRVRDNDKWNDRNSLSMNPMVYVAPNLLEKDLDMFETLENMRLETQLSDAGQAYRTEGKCEHCSRIWGARSEELGRAYILQKLESESFAQRKALLMSNVVTAVRQVYYVLRIGTGQELSSTDLQWINGILYLIHGVLVQTRADPSASISRRSHLLRLECLVDDLCRMVQGRMEEDGNKVEVEEGGGGSEKLEMLDSDPLLTRGSQVIDSPWRNEGVYKFTRCTDSVHGLEVTLLPVESELPFSTLLKDELDYLDGFRYLCHSPGLYCLGQQQDPNHEEPKILPVFDVKTSPFRRLIPKRKRSRNSDTFMDNHTLAFACALSMIHDPRSLLVHGIYDRVDYPGTIIRRPKLPPAVFSSTSPPPRAVLVERSSVLVKKWKSQNLTKTTASILRHRRKVSPMLSTEEQFCLLYGELDIQSHSLLHLSYDEDQEAVHHVTAFNSYQENIPPPGTGQHVLSARMVSSSGRSEIVPLQIGDSDTRLATVERRETENVDWLVRGPAGTQAQPPRVNQNARPPVPFGPPGNGPRVINLIWLMSAHFGWAVDDTQGAGSVLVDRKILIATQWVSNSLMTLPLLWTLVARYIQRITPKPINYYLDGLPHEVDNEMRYLTAAECGSAAVLVLALWLIMGRYAERRISRSFERAMMEHLSKQQGADVKMSLLSRTVVRAFIWFQRQWDRISPLFLQRLVFSPRWNHRSESDVQDHVTAWRSKDLREHRAEFQAECGQGVATHGASVEDGGPPVDYKEESPLKKILTGLVVSLGSFTATSPHFFLNLLTVFSCSIALGMSMSLQSMEVGRQTKNSHSTLKPLALNTIVIMSFLVGQLIGSSGGLLFLAEFVVTTVSLVLGGAGTISASAMESWGCFFCLSSTAFWGYLFARVALIDGIRHKRRRPSSVVLCSCLVVIAGLWLGTLWIWQWDLPPNIMIIRPPLQPMPKKLANHRLQ